MIVLNAFIEVIVGKEADFLQAVKPLIESTRKEDGNHLYQLYQDKNEFVFIEHWENQSALDIHSSSAHFKKFVEVAGPLFAKPLKIESYKK